MNERVSVIVSPQQQALQANEDDHLTPKKNISDFGDHHQSNNYFGSLLGHHRGNSGGPKDHQRGGGTEQGANRMSYPREFKLLVISYYFQHGQNKYRTCKEFQITKSMLNGWLQKVDKIQQSRPGSLKSGRSGRKPQFPTVEKQLYHVYQACLTAGKKVGNRWLRETAKLIAQDQCTQEELNGMCQFSERWLCNFKKRYNINLTKDWNGDLIGGGKPSSDGISCGTPTPETYSTEDSPTTTNCEADSSTSPKKSESPPVPGEIDGDESLTEDQLEPPPPKILADIIEADLTRKLLHSPSRSSSVNSLAPMMRNQSLKITPVVSAGGTGFQPYEPGRRGRKVQFPQVEEILYKNLLSKQSEGVRVSNRWLQDEARRLAVELCPEMFTNAFKSARCMFSEHWLHNFKKRYGISLKQQNPSTNVSFSSASAAAPRSLPNDEEELDSSATEHIKEEPQQQQQEATRISNNLWEFQLEAAAASLLNCYRQQPNHHFGGDDLPTMVPLTTLSRSLTKINLAEWYSKISNNTTHNVGQCIQMLTDELRLRKSAVATTAESTAANITNPHTD